MLGSAIVYSALGVLFAGLISILRPLRLLRIKSRRKGALVAAGGAALLLVGLRLPASVVRAGHAETHLDRFASQWQFREFHSLRIAAPPERVYQAVTAVTADEIFLFRTLTWIRRAGRPLPRTILDAGTERPLLEVATSSDFVMLADDPPREIVIGTVVISPPGARTHATPELYRNELPPGFALATMNFLIRSEVGGGSVLSTETRVFASDDDARRRFAVYWRVIYPGSSLIRRMWLRAIRARATS